MPIYIQVVSSSSSNMQGTILVSSFIKINHMDQPKRTEVDSHLRLSQTRLPRHSFMHEPWSESPGLPESGRTPDLGQRAVCYRPQLLSQQGAGKEGGLFPVVFSSPVSSWWGGLQDPA